MWGLILGGEFAVLQGSPERSRRAPMFDGLSFDPFSLFDDGCGSAEVGVGGSHVAQALMIALVIVMVDEGLDLGFEVAGKEVVFLANAVLQALMPALDLALGLRVEGRAAHVAHALGFDIFRQLARDVAGTIIRQQAWPVMYMCLIAARCRQRQVQRIGDVLSAHRAAELPGD